MPLSGFVGAASLLRVSEALRLKEPFRGITAPECMRPCNSHLRYRSETDELLPTTARTRTGESSEIQVSESLVR
ncbi:MAG: hypothetical protein V3R89_06520, partial [Thermoanaerobaculia bacterium]